MKSLSKHQFTVITESVRTCLDGCSEHLNETYQDAAEQAEVELTAVLCQLASLSVSKESLEKQNTRLAAKVRKLKRGLRDSAAKVRRLEKSLRDTEGYYNSLGFRYPVVRDHP